MITTLAIIAWIILVNLALWPLSRGLVALLVRLQARDARRRVNVLAERRAAEHQDFDQWTRELEDHS